MDHGDAYARLYLHVAPEKFYIQPLSRDGSIATDSHLEIDRHSNQIRLAVTSLEPIPQSNIELRSIFGIVGIVRLVSGPALIVITRAQLVGLLNDQEIWSIVQTETLPYQRTTLHLTEKQIWYNRHFTDMIQLVLSTGGFFYSATFDLSHSLQWLQKNATPAFRQLSMMARADERFVWNRFLSAELMTRPELSRYALPIIHGFVGIRPCRIGDRAFQLILISRRSIYRAGTRFNRRGLNVQGDSANFVETEQIVECGNAHGGRSLTAFVQTRGSIPLLWSQRPNLQWQPLPTMKLNDDQLEAYVKHMRSQQRIYDGPQVLINLVNQTGREKSIGDELGRVWLQASLENVKYVPFDFHRECRAMNWHRLSILIGKLKEFILAFEYFSLDCLPGRADSCSRVQSGIFRSNCMDCLDRTNVVQTMIAKESLMMQLVQHHRILDGTRPFEDFTDFARTFHHLWADNGDACSMQYAGTAALKADFTRLGKRTMTGAFNDLRNALTRYYRNNFQDGYRQDAIDLFLGNFRVDPANLPSTLERTMLSLDYHGGAIIGAIFAGAMVLLCILVADNVTATLFWFIIFFALMLFIFFNGEEFVNTPKLHID